MVAAQYLGKLQYKISESSNTSRRLAADMGNGNGGARWDACHCHLTGRFAAIADGKSRAGAAAVGLMDRQTLRDWIVRFYADGPKGLINERSSGRPPKLTSPQKQEVQQLVEDGPGPHDLHLVRWRRADLAGVVKDWITIDWHSTTIGRMLQGLDFSHVSPRPRYPEKDDHAAEVFKKTLPRG